LRNATRTRELAPSHGDDKQITRLPSTRLTSGAGSDAARLTQQILAHDLGYILLHSLIAEKGSLKEIVPLALLKAIFYTEKDTAH